MSIQTLLPIALFTLTAAISPGGATTLVTVTGANHGFRRAVPLIGGLAAALALMALASGVGLGALSRAVPSLHSALKVVGSLYLAWLAWQVGKRGMPSFDATSLRPPGFATGVWVQSSNPKAWAVTTGAAASFAAAAEGPLHLGLLLGSLFGLSAIVSLTLWCQAGSLLAKTLRTDLQWHVVNAILGVLLALSIAPLWLD